MIVAPLHVQVADEKSPRLHPLVQVGETTYFLMVERLAAVDRKELGKVVGTARECEEAIKRAIDLSFFGF